jgi:hypothetical protein
MGKPTKDEIDDVLNWYAEVRDDGSHSGSYYEQLAGLLDPRSLLRQARHPLSELSLSVTARARCRHLPRRRKAWVASATSPGARASPRRTGRSSTRCAIGVLSAPRPRESRPTSYAITARIEGGKAQRIPPIPVSAEGGMRYRFPALRAGTVPLRTSSRRTKRQPPSMRPTPSPSPRGSARDGSMSRSPRFRPRYPWACALLLKLLVRSPGWCSFTRGNTDLLRNLKRPRVH